MLLPKKMKLDLSSIEDKGRDEQKLTIKTKFVYIASNFIIFHVVVSKVTSPLRFHFKHFVQTTNKKENDTKLPSFFCGQTKKSDQLP